MALPAPDLDDRHFQDLVDDAKRLVQQRCPAWSDHNVSDPGVTLIEAYAQMVDQLIYRLNRVPDRNYVKFLELIDVQLRPPSAARGEVTFWLSAPQPQPVVVRTATEVATPRTDLDAPIVFTTTEQLEIVPCSLEHAGSQPAGGTPFDRTDSLGEEGFNCFGERPAVDDALLIGLSNAVPSCAVVLRIDCEVAGAGIDPKHPPTLWEAWTGAAWEPCDVDSDGTGGLNKQGDIVLHVPSTHQASRIARQHGGWLRCRIVEPEEGQREYRMSPHINAVSAYTIGGTARTVHAEVVDGELLGISTGAPAQRFVLQRRPVLLSEGEIMLEAVAGEGEHEEIKSWRRVRSFASSRRRDRHFRLDAVGGEIEFGPLVREADGSTTQYGSVPPAGARLRVISYRTGGGRRGNVARGQVRVLKTSVPYVARVENRKAAVGGAEAESLDEAKVRGPMQLRSRGRAVTREDYEELAREVAPDIARAYCAEVDDAGPGGGVRLLVVPHLPPDVEAPVERQHLDPPLETLARIAAFLDERRLIGTRLVVEPPSYRWLTVVVSAHARPGFRPDDVRDQVLAAVYRLFHPLVGGPDGQGWPFGRPVQSHEVAAVLARLISVDMSRELSVQLFPSDAGGVAGRHGERVDRLDLEPTELVFSYQHQVRVQA
jgi:predicted phage baseplate assembly protein